MITLFTTPNITGSSFRRFNENERHITRIYPEYVLIFLLDGCLKFVEDGISIALKANEWYIQKPNLLQEGTEPSDKPYYYYVHFQVPQLLNSAPTDYLSISNRGVFNPIVCMENFKSLEKYRSLSNLYKLDFQIEFLKLFRHIIHSDDTLQDPEVILANKVFNFVENHFTRSQIPDMLEETFHFSYPYLCKLTKKYRKVTPVQYMHELRITKAKQLLNSTDLIVENIAQSVGFSELSIFFKLFKKHTGNAPNAWRRKSRGI